jgi:hypothetical protein
MKKGSTMNMWKNIGAGITILTIVALGFLPFSSARAEKAMEHMEQMITEAKTPADHEALAAFYEKEAQEARQKQAQHQQMSEEYAKIPVLKTKTGAVAHCQAIAKKYEEIAKENEALAQMHKEMATAAK